MINYRVLSVFAICVVSAPAFALDQGDYRLNGFGTVGVTHLGGGGDAHEFGVSAQTNDSWRGDQLSKFGGQFQYGLTNTIGFTTQVIAKAQSDQWQLRPEWMYLSWQATDKLMFRVGKLGSPVYMYSETLNIGYTNPWIRLPDEVYSQVQLNSYRGADAVYTQPLSFGSLTLQIAGGQSTNDNNYILAVDENVRTDYKNILFVNATLATNDFGSLRLGYTQANVHSYIHDTVQPSFGAPVDVTFQKLTGNKGTFTSLGYQYDKGTWVTSAETTVGSAAGDGQGKSVAFYTMAGRHFGDFLAHVTYGQLDDDAGRETSWTYGLNYNVTPTVIVKGEFKRVDVSGGGTGVFSRTGQQTFDNGTYNSTNGLLGSPSRNFDGDIVSIGVDFVF